MGCVPETIVACTSMGDAGIRSWDSMSGALVMRRPTCASPKHGLVMVGHHHLAASQIQRAGSVGRGEIFFWALNKIQAERCYTMEPIIPLSCTSNGVYLAGGGLSGKLYLWEVSSLTLLYSWPGHLKTISCLAFSHDDSLLISGADDGTIYVWPLIRVADALGGSSITEAEKETMFLHCWAEHRGPVTAVICGSGSANGLVVSSSVDYTCKIWSLALGTLLQTIELQSAVNCVIFGPGEQILYAGTENGKIVTQDMNLLLSPACIAWPDSLYVVFGSHRQAITTLALSMDWRLLISASEDGTIRVWDIIQENPVRELFIKGPVTNLLTVSQTNADGCHREFELWRGRSAGSTFSGTQRISGSGLHKDPLVILPASSPTNREAGESHSYSSKLLSCQIRELERSSTPAALQFLAEETRGMRAMTLETIQRIDAHNYDVVNWFYHKQ